MLSVEILYSLKINLRKKMTKLAEAWLLNLILVMKEEEPLETNKN